MEKNDIKAAYNRNGKCANVQRKYSSSKYTVTGLNFCILLMVKNKIMFLYMLFTQKNVGE